MIFFRKAMRKPNKLTITSPVALFIPLTFSSVPNPRRCLDVFLTVSLKKHLRVCRLEEIDEYQNIALSNGLSMCVLTVIFPDKIFPGLSKV